MQLTQKILILASIGSTLWGGTVLADGTNAPPATPPVVVPRKPDLSKLPPEVQALIKDFQTTRQTYLAKQKALFEQLKGATPAEKEAIREQLQGNRQAFLDEVHAIRTEIKKDMKEKHDAALDRWLKNHTDPKPRKGSGQ